MKKNRYFLLLLFPILTSCPMIDYFPEYTGVNVIGDGNSLTLMNSTHWERVLIDTTTPSAHTIFETVTGQTGPTPGSSILRLEALNQLQNGDFHDGSTGWSSTDNVTLTSQTLPTTRLVYTRGAAQKFLYNELDNALTSYKNNGNYQVRMLFSSSNTGRWYMAFVVGENNRIVPDGYNNDIQPTPEIVAIERDFREPDGKTTIILNKEITQPNPGTQFLLSSRNINLVDTQNAFMVIPSPGINTTLHWVQILENNPDLYSIETRLPKLPQIDRPDLLLRAGGTYTISLWVKADDPAFNRFTPSEMAIELVGFKRDVSSDEIIVSKSSINSIELPTIDNWTEVTINVKSPLQDYYLQELSNDDEAMGIRIYPFDPYHGNAEDATVKSGSLLISNLKLFWSPR